MLSSLQDITSDDSSSISIITINPETVPLVRLIARRNYRVNCSSPRIASSNGAAVIVNKPVEDLIPVVRRRGSEGFIIPRIVSHESSASRLTNESPLSSSSSSLSSPPWFFLERLAPTEISPTRKPQYGATEMEKIIVNYSASDLKHNLLRFVKNDQFYSETILNPPLHNYVYSNIQLCDKSRSEDDVFLLIMVVSATTEGNLRRAIRKTWGDLSADVSAPSSSSADDAGRPSRRRVVLVFLLAKSKDVRVEMNIDRENARYGDIVKEDFMDSYDNLTLKTLMGIQWASNFCSQARYVLKIDSDTLLNVNALLAHLDQLPDSNVFQGHVHHNSKPIRDYIQPIYMKWKVSLEEYPYERYPEYVNGPSYVISGNLLKLIVAMSEHVPFLRLEDVYMGMIMQTIGVAPKHDDRFTQVKFPLKLLPTASDENISKLMCYFSTMFTVKNPYKNVTLIHDFWRSWRKWDTVKTWTVCGKNTTIPQYNSKFQL